MEKSAALSPQALAFAGLKCNLITTDKLSREKHHPWDKRKIICKHQFDFDGIEKEPSRKAPFYKDCGKRGCPENDKLEGPPHAVPQLNYRMPEDIVFRQGIVHTTGTLHNLVRRRPENEAYPKGF